MIHSRKLLYAVGLNQGHNGIEHDSIIKLNQRQTRYPKENYT